MSARDVGLRFRHLRERKCLTQAALAKRAGVHRNTVINTEHNPDQVRLELLTRQAAVLGQPLWRILREKKDAHANVHRPDSPSLRSADMS